MLQESWDCQGSGYLRYDYGEERWVFGGRMLFCHWAPLGLSLSCEHLSLIMRLAGIKSFRAGGVV